MTSQVVDTALNITVFIYVGFLVWLALQRT